MGVHRLKKLLQGDLDNIVLMALRKEPTRRYSSASQLADDIERYRNGLPVHAQKDSVSYRVNKFIRRHRILVGITSVFFVILLGFSLLTAYQSRMLKTERDTARIEKDRAEQVIGLLVNLFETANPAVAPGGDTLRVREFIKQGTEKILEDIQDDEALSIELKHTIAKMYAAQGQYQEARRLYQEAFELQETRYGRDDTTTTAYLYDLAVQTWRLGDVETARPMFHEILERHIRIFGPEHPRVAASLLALSLATRDREEQHELLESALSLRRKLLPAHHMDIAESLNQLAIFHIDGGNWQEAARLFRESLDILEETLPANHPNVLAVMNNLSTSLNQAGNTGEAITIQHQVIDRLQDIVSDSSVQMSNSYNNLAVLLTNEGEFEEAETIFRRVLGIQEHLLGESHGRVTSTKRNLAIVLSSLGRHEEAVQFMSDALAAERSQIAEVGEKSVGAFQTQYAILLLEAGQLDNAYLQAQQALDLLETASAPEDLQLSNGQFTWGIILMARGELDNALPYIQQSLKTRESIYDPDDARVAEIECVYGRLLALQNKPEEAQILLERALPIYAAWPRANQNWLSAARETLEKLR